MRIKLKDDDAIRIYGWMIALDWENYAEIVVFAYIYGWCKSTGTCYRRREYLAEWLKGDASWVDRIILSLEDKGYIWVDGDKWYVNDHLLDAGDKC